MPTDLSPQLLYRSDGDQARFATWRLADGHEALALFTGAYTADKYRTELPDANSWVSYEPMCDKLIDILRACHSAGIRYAALDPIAGQARTLFDIPRVLTAADQRPA